MQIDRFSTMTIDISSTSAINSYRTTPLNAADADDAVNQYDFPSTTTTSTTGSSVSAPPLPFKQQDIDFDLFTANAQVIPDISTTGMEQNLTNVDATTTDKMALHHTIEANNEERHLLQLPSSARSDRTSLVNGGPIRSTTTTTSNDEDCAVVQEPMTTTERRMIATTEQEDVDSNAVTLPPPSQQRFVSPKDFELLKVIGMGAFGKVLQVRNKCTQHIYAMKIISKRLLYKKGTSVIDNVLVERNILQRISSHPFIVTMQCSFQTREKLFIIMDYLAGGELFLRLGREGIFLEKTAAFYLSEIILAIEHLHSNNILHRDLKPENILLSCDGHVCITDFGLAKDFTRDPDTTVSTANTLSKKPTTTTTTDTNPSCIDTTTNNDIGGKEVKDNNSINNEKPPLPDDENNDDQHRAKTICGTGEYMAPEMIARQGYGRSADYWSLGCIAYEMLSGRPPFDSKQGAKILFLKIMTERIKMPSGSSAAACKLLKGLLNRNVSARLGAAKSTMFEVGGVAGLKKVDFFASIDWDKLLHKQIDPPATFSVDHDEDVQYFHDEFTTMPLPRSVLDMSMEHFQAKRVESEAFRGFSFIHDDFILPSRNDMEEKAYWESIEEDGESLSDCASSINGGNNDELQSPTPSKRPPRKRKKKGTATSGANGELSGSVISTTTPNGTSNNTPMGSAVNTPEPSESGDIIDQLDTLGINDNNVSPLVTNVIEAVINHSKMNNIPIPVSPRIMTNSSLPVRTPPATTKPIVQEEEWFVATGNSKKETPVKQKQRNNLTPHMNSNTNPNSSITPRSATIHSTPPVPPFTRGVVGTSAYQRNGVSETSKRFEATPVSQQQKQQASTAATPPVNSRANGWNQISSPYSSINTGGGLQRLSSPSAQQQSSRRSAPGEGQPKPTSTPSPATTSADWRSQRPNAPVNAAPSSDWRNHSMANRINVDQQQQHSVRQQTYPQSTIPAALSPSSIPVATVWPSLTKGDVLAKNPSSIAANKTENITTKAPTVTGAWAARVSKS